MGEVFCVCEGKWWGEDMGNGVKDLWWKNSLR